MPMFGTPVRHFQVIGSTNDAAMEWARAGAPHGALVRADAQTQGRGRSGREWNSPAGLGLYLSLVLRPQLELSRVPQLTMLAALAAARTVEKQVKSSAHVKWPNDIVLNGHKIGGILSEARGREGAAEWIDFAVVGMGLNINFQADDLPLAPKIPASSLLLETGKRWSLDAIAEAWLGEMQALCTLLDGGWEALREEFQARDILQGREVMVETSSGTYPGIAAGIAPDGVLLVQTPSEMRRVLAGDVGLSVL